MRPAGLHTRHELLEARTLDRTQERRRRHLELLEGDLVLAHAAVAQHPDLAAAHARRRERVAFAAPRLVGEEQAQAAMSFRLGVGAHQQDHQVGARGVGGPGLGAGHFVVFADPDGTGAHGGQVGAGLRFAEDGGGNDLAGGDPGQVAPPLRLGAGEADQLRRDLRARGEGAGTKMSARQLLGHHAHGEPAHAEAAVLLGHGEGEHPQLGHAANEVEGDERILGVPAPGVGCDLLVGEAAELSPHELERVVEAGVAESLGHVRRDAVAGGAGVALGHEAGRRRVGKARSRRLAQPRAHDLALAHGDAALELAQILAEAGGKNEGLQLAQGPGRLQALGPAVQLAQGLHGGGDPGQAVGGKLCVPQPHRVGPAVDDDPAGDGAVGVGEIGVRRRQRLSAQAQQFSYRQDRCRQGPSHPSGRRRRRARAAGRSRRR